MRDCFIFRLCQIAEHNPRVMLLTGDLGFAVFDEFRSRFPRQFLNVGVAEQNLTGVATGLALEGRVVFTYSIGNFPTLRCLEQIRSDVLYHNANVNIVSVGSGFSYGALGMSHHATEDISIMRALPGLTIMSPGDDWEAEECTQALVMKQGPGYLRLDKSSAGNTKKPGEIFQLGQGRVLREGNNATLITTGGILKLVLEVADQLALAKLPCRVISLPTLKPLDWGLIERGAMETGGIVTIEEHTVEGGLGSLVAEHLLESGIIPEKFFRIGLRDGFPTVVGSQEYLRSICKIDSRSIFETLAKFLQREEKLPHRGVAR